MSMWNHLIVMMSPLPKWNHLLVMTSPLPRVRKWNSDDEPTPKRLKVESSFSDDELVSTPKRLKVEYGNVSVLVLP